METLYPRCAGIDVHKKTVVVCVRRADGPGKPRQEVRTFATMTADLLALSDWLAEGGSLTWRFSQPCGSLPHVGPPGQVWGPPTCGILPHSGRPPRAGFGPRAMRQQYRAARMPEAPACGRAVRTPAFPARLASALRNLAHTPPTDFQKPSRQNCPLTRSGWFKEQRMPRRRRPG